MWKKALLWMFAAVTAAGFGLFLASVAKTYGLPPAAAVWQLTPETVTVMFVFVLIGVGGADIVRYFLKAGIRVKRSARQANPAIEPVETIPDESPAERIHRGDSQAA